MDNVINVNEIIRRIKELKTFKTDRQVADFLGVSKATVSNWMARNSIDFPLLINKLDGVDLTWLLTGRGNPEHRDNPCHDPLAEGEVQMLRTPRVPEALNDRSVTLYDVTAAANLKTLFTNKHQFALGEIVIPNIPSCDGAVYVSGDSMYPLLKSGDIVGYKEIHSFSNIIFGEMYLVAFDLDGDEYLTVKYVNQSEQPESIRLVSYNPHHAPQDIPPRTIKAMAIVQCSIRRNMMV